MATDRIALVTGAGKRLGKAIARGLANEGYAMGLHYNSSAEGAQDLHDEIVAEGGKAALLQKDLSRPETAGGLIEDTAAALGGSVEVLVNSASAFHEKAWRNATMTRSNSSFVSSDGVPPPK